MILLKDIVNIDKMNDAIKNNLVVSQKNSDDDSIWVLCYSKIVQFKGIWIPETLIARGLVIRASDGKIDDSTVVLARGITKFFTVEHSKSDWGALKLIDDDENVVVEKKPMIEMNSPAIVADKWDGTLGVGYINDGKLSISTKGSFDTMWSHEGNKILKDRVEMAKFLKAHYEGMTPLFEVILPEADHVIDYGETKDNIFLGFVDMKTGLWHPADKDNGFVKEFDLDIPKIYKADNLTEALELNVPDHEGVVVTISNHDGTQSMFKVKYESYLKLRSVKKDFTKKSVRDTIKDLDAQDVINGSVDFVKVFDKDNEFDENVHEYIKKNSELLVGIVDTIKMKYEKVVSDWDDFYDGIIKDGSTMKDVMKDKKTRDEFISYVNGLDDLTSKAFLKFKSNILSGRDDKSGVYEIVRDTVLKGLK